MNWRSDRGSMLVEVTFLMVLVLLPLFYLVGTVGRLQAGAYAASAAAREAGRAYVTAADDASGAGRGAAAAQLVFGAHGFRPGQGRVSLACAASPCLTPGSEIQIDATVEVPLPLIPRFMSDTVPTAVTMRGQHTEAVDEFRSGATS